jgi:hypothetical protein
MIKLSENNYHATYTAAISGDAEYNPFDDTLDGVFEFFKGGYNPCDYIL